MRSVSELKKRLKKVKALLLDVDGVLTDGRLWWIEGTGWIRAFDVRDGYGIRMLLKSGFEVAWMSGADSKCVRERAQSLGVTKLYLGDENKLHSLEKFMQETGLNHDELAFVGDELFDIPVLKAVGFSATVPDAVGEVKDAVHHVTERHGGRGAVREIADLILKT